MCTKRVEWNIFLSDQKNDDDVEDDNNFKIEKFQKKKYKQKLAAATLKLMLPPFLAVAY